MIGASNTGSVTAGVIGVGGVAVGDQSVVLVQNASTGIVNAGLAGVIGVGIGDGDKVKVTNDGAVTAGQIGVGGLVVGDNNSVNTINSGSVDPDIAGVISLAVGDGNTVDVANSGAVTAGLIGVGGLAFGNDNTVTVQNAGTGSVTADTAGVIGLGIGDGNGVVVDNYGTVAAGVVGVAGVAIGDGISVDVSTSGAVAAGTIGVAGVGVGSGDVTVDVLGPVQSDGIGVFAFKGGDGDTTVTVDGPISGRSAAATGMDGVSVVNTDGSGLVLVTTSVSGTIVSAGDGIAVDKSSGDGDGTNAVIVNSAGSITASGNGVNVVQDSGDGNLVVTTSGVINAGAAGVTVSKTDGEGDVSILANANVSAANGLIAYGEAQDGDATITTAAGTTISATQTGISATKLSGGSGTVSINTGSQSVVVAGGTGIAATNSVGGGSANVFVTIGTGASVQAGTDAVSASGSDSVTVSASNGSRVRGDSGQTGTGRGIAISSGAAATVNVGAGSVISGSGTDWSNAVLSVTSGTAANITIATGALVTPWAYDGSSAANSDLATAASRIAVNAAGGATTLNNYGTLVGRIGLSNNADIFNNFSSNTWVVVGDNNFGGGSDTLSNPGRIQTALNGAVGEQTNLSSLESFVNGDPTGVGLGLVSLSDETAGQLAFNANRDVTYTSGTFTGVGNSTLAVDAYLGGPGSTSDRLVVGGLDVNGNPISGAVTYGTTKILVNDVNSGPGGYNPSGIAIVEAQNGSTPAGTFSLDPNSAHYSSRFGGIIDKGLFFYDLATTPAATGSKQVLVGLPGQEALEFPSFITGAQTIWHETAGLWLDRQADLRSYFLNPPQASPGDASSKLGAGAAEAAQKSLAPGVWAKAVGNWMTRDSSVSYSSFDKNFDFDTSYNQNTYGFMAGADIGGNITDKSAILFGVLGGYITSQLNFDQSPTSGDYTGGTVGVYGTYINGGFFLDGLVKADFLNLDYSAPTLSGYGGASQSSDVTSLGFVIDSGYRIQWTPQLFFEPVATLAYVNASIDNMASISDSLVEFNDGESLRGAVGARFGGRIYDAESYWIEASAVGRLWYEFDGDNSATILNAGAPFTATDNFGGAFGELGGSVNLFGKDSGWSGFVNADVKFSNEFTAGTALTGVRYNW